MEGIDRKRLIAVATAFALASAAPLAQAQNQGEGDFLDGVLEKLTKENVGKGVGGVLGGVLGSQIGDGSGKTAATIVGALAGYWLGGEVGRRMQESDRYGLAQTTATAMDTGQPQSWVNPETGVRTEVQVQDVRYVPESQLTEAPPLEFINAYYVAETRSHVRSGPGTRFPIVDQLETNEQVAVIGQVVDQDWYMVAQNGRGYGFVYSPLLNPAARQPADSNAIRADAGDDFGDQDLGGHALAQPECTLVTQKVTMPDGRASSEQFRACRNADGSWEVV